MHFIPPLFLPLNSIFCLGFPPPPLFLKGAAFSFSILNFAAAY
jgi:hypothetical protein